MSRLSSLFADLGEKFDTPRAKPAKLAPTPTTPKSAPKPEQRNWLPISIVMYATEWQCSCGNHGHHIPTLMLRERAPIGGIERLRRIEDARAFGTLPRERESAPPVMINECDACFEETIFSSRQLDFGFDVIAAPFVRALSNALFDETREQRAERIRAMRADFEAGLKMNAISLAFNTAQHNLAAAPADTYTIEHPVLKWRKPEYLNGTVETRIVNTCVGPDGPEMLHCQRILSPIGA